MNISAELLLATASECSDLSVHCVTTIMRHVYPLLGNDREIRNYTRAVTRPWSVNSNRGIVFYVLPVLRCYKQDKVGVTVS